MNKTITLFKLSCIVSDIETISGKTLDVLMFSNTYYIIDSAVVAKRNYTNRVVHMLHDAEAAFVIEYDSVRVIKELRTGGLLSLFKKHNIDASAVESLASA